MEIELKLLIDPANKDTLRLHPLLARHAEGAPREKAMHAIYFDTPGFLLLSHGAGLRVREADGQWTQTMKAGGSISGGLHQRNEWESEIPGPMPEPGALAALVGSGSPWEKLLQRVSTTEKLRPLFSVDVTRTIWHLDVDGDKIELALDLGSIERDGEQVPVSEIELELLSGSPNALYALALRLLDDMPLRLSDISKAARGYALCLPPKVNIVRAQPLALRSSQTVEHGMRAIFSACLAQIHGNEAGVADSSDAESVHQMRIGLRRLRSALRLFQGVCALPEDWLEDLRWLGNVLGAARDWEVLSSGTLAAAANAVRDIAFLDALRQQVATIAQVKRADAAQTVASARYSRLMLRLFAWVEGASWRDDLHADTRKRLAAVLGKWARAAMKRQHKRMLRRGRRLSVHDADALHRLRIAAKNARYMSEFFAALYRRKPLRRHVAALTALQDELGALHDLSSSVQLLQQLAAEHPALADATAFVRGWLSAQLARPHRRTLKTWKRFRRAGLPARG